MLGMRGRALLQQHAETQRLRKLLHLAGVVDDRVIGAPDVRDVGTGVDIEKADQAVERRQRARQVDQYQRVDLHDEIEQIEAKPIRQRRGEDARVELQELF